VVEGFEVAFLEKADSTGPVSTFFQIGTQPPHATAIGKALLAFAAPKIADRVLKGPLRRYTRSTIVCPEQAVPVFGPGNTVPVALQLSSRTSADTRLVLPALKMAAARCPMSCTFTTRGTRW